MARGANIVGSAAVEILPSFELFSSRFGQGLSESLLAPTLAAGAAFESAGKYLLTRFTLPLAVATAANVVQFQALDRELRTTLTLLGTAGPLVTETFDKMSDGIRGVAREVGGLERDLADGLYQTISAGIPRKDAFDFLKVAQMAAFADKTADVTTAVDGITTAINAWNLEASDATRVSDVFFATVAKGKTTFGEIANDIGRVAPLAASAGVSLEETSAILGTLTLQGLKTSEAISFMRAAITGVLRPSEDMNAIFREIGFVSAEAAIPVIGLQAAFEVMNDAVGGSTSKMQELIGTSEGVSAVLGVTGDNASTFEGVMRSVENSVGNSASAFAIMDDSAGRAFGRLGESFSRLGNTFGLLSSELLAPIASGFAPVIDKLADGFDMLKPAVRGLGGFIEKLMGAFDNPIMVRFAATLAGVIISVGGLLGVLGPLVFALGKFLIIKAVIKTWQILIGVINSFSLSASGASVMLGKLADKVPATTALSRGFGKQVGFASSALGKLGSSALLTFAPLSLIAAALAAGVVVAVLYNKGLNRMKRMTDTTGEAVERLAVSLGVTLSALKEFNAESGDFSIDFNLENQDLITAVMKTLDTVGAAAAEDVIIGIAWEWYNRGASEEEIGFLIRNFEALEGIGDIEVNFATDFRGVDAGLGRFQARLQTSIATLDNMGLTGQETWTTLTDASRAWVDSFRAAKTYEEVEQVFGALKDVEGQLTNVLGGSTRFYKDILRITDAGRDLGFDLDFGKALFGGIGVEQEVSKAENVIAQLRDKLSLPVSTLPSTLKGYIESTAASINPITEAINELSEEAVAVQKRLIDGIPGVFAGGREQIAAAFGEIRTQFLNQMPLLSIYGGAVKQSFAEWHKGQLAFQADMEAVATLRRDTISKLPQEVQDAFDSASISEQAWLTTLGDANLKTAMEDLAASAAITLESAGGAMETAATKILQGVNTAMGAEFTIMRDEAYTTGETVGSNFDTALGLGAGEWAGTAAGYISDLKAQMSVFIPGPTVGPVSYQTGSGPPSPAGGVSVHVEVNNPVGETTEESIQSGLSSGGAVSGLLRGPG